MKSAQLALRLRPVFGLVILCGEVGVQVSEEAPSFATDSKFGDLLVVVVPHQVGLPPVNSRMNHFLSTAANDIRSSSSVSSRGGGGAELHGGGHHAPRQHLLVHQPEIGQ